MWIMNAWQHISLEVSVKGFKKCCISNAVDGTEDDVLQNDSEEEGGVRTVCEEDEGTDCENGESDIEW
jgi:hypothetical protein